MQPRRLQREQSFQSCVVGVYILAFLKVFWRDASSDTKSFSGVRSIFRYLSGADHCVHVTLPGLAHG
jgi:hypothetical protein